MCLGSAMPAFAQSQPTASDLYQQGKALYEAGNLDEAGQVLRRADPFQLSREDRLSYYKLLTNISRGEGPSNAAVAKQENENPTLETAQANVAAENQATGSSVAGVQEITNQPVASPVAGVQGEQTATTPLENTNNTTTGATEIGAAGDSSAVTGQDVLARNRQLHANQKVAEAQAAMNNGNYALAARLYDQALAFDPDNAQIQSMRDEAIAAANKNNVNVPSTSLETNVASRNLDQQAAYAEYSNAMTESQKQLDQQNYGLAEQEARRALQIIDRQRKDLFPPDEERQYREKADQLLARIEAARKQDEAIRTAEANEKQKVEAINRQKEALAKTADEIDGLLRRAMELKKQRQYDEALQLVDQVLYLDPNNVAGQLLQEAITNDRLLDETRIAIRARNLGAAEEMLHSYEQTTLQQDMVVYPPDWPEITRRRLMDLDDSGGESEANRRVALRLREAIPVDFESNQLSSVIEFLRGTTGQNFFVNWAALEQAGVEKDAPVTLTLNNVPADRILKLVLQQVSSGDLDQIDYSIIDGIVNISTVRDLQRSTEIRNYDIRDLLVQVPNFTEAPAFDLTNVLQNTTSGGGGGSSSLFGDTSSEAQAGDDPTELLQNIMELIRDQVGDPLGWADRGGEVSSMKELNGNLIVKTTPENHRQLISLLSRLRETRAVQISVEARFLLVQQDFLEEIGIDMDIQIAAGQTLTGGTDANGNPLPINFNQDSSGLAAGGPTALTPTRFADFLNGVQNAAGPALGFGLSYTPYYLDDLTLNLIVQATQANSEQITLTAPRVTFFNGQRAYVLVARQYAFVSDLEPVPDALSFDPTLSVVQSGVVLDVQGTISSDRRYVTMTLRPSLATLAQSPIRSIAIPLAVPAGTDAFAPPQYGFIEAPELELTQIRSTVSVPDQGTLMIGGQKLVQEVDYEAGVPVLSKIPVISRFFSNTSTVKDERTLLILVKPTIIIQSELEENLFPGLNADPAGYNLTSFRQGS